MPRSTAFHSAVTVSTQQQRDATNLILTRRWAFGRRFPVRWHLQLRTCYDYLFIRTGCHRFHPCGSSSLTASRTFDIETICQTSREVIIWPLAWSSGCVQFASDVSVNYQSVIHAAASYACMRALACIRLQKLRKQW